MFPVGAAAIFLVNRPCFARHRPAKTVIAGLCIQRSLAEFAADGAQQTLSSPGLTRRSIVRRGNSLMGRGDWRSLYRQTRSAPSPLVGEGWGGGSSLLGELCPPTPTP